jgi:hypothetical protein
MKCCVAHSLVFLLAFASACTSTKSEDVASSSEATPAPAETPASAEAPAPAPTQAPPQPVRVEQPRDAVAIDHGGFYSCALQRAGTVACWRNTWTDPPDQPVLVPGIEDAVAIATAFEAACVVRRDGRVVCWAQAGDADSGELGNGIAKTEPGLFEVMGVRGATGLSGGVYSVCASTRSSRPWCWGWFMGPRSLLPSDSDRHRYGPWEITLDGVRAMHLRRRTYAYVDEGMWTLDGIDEPVLLPDVVEANSAHDIECFVRRSGEVRCKLDDGSDMVLERLHGARQLLIADLVGMVAGILPDGTLVAQAVRGGFTPTFAEGNELVALASSEHVGKLLGIRRDGRVFEWKAEREGAHHFVAREIVLPDPSTVTPAPIITRDPPPEYLDELPSWCEVETRIVSPVDVDSLAAIATQIGADGSDRAALCRTFVSEGTNECMEDGPWFVSHEHQVALVVPVDGGRFGRIPDLGIHSDGAEKRSVIAEIWSVDPVDAWLQINESKRDCGDEEDEEDEEEDEDLCPMLASKDTHVMITQLADGRYLRVDVRIDMLAAGRKQWFHAASIEVADDTIELDACDGRIRLPLPAGEQELPSL